MLTLTTAGMACSSIGASDGTAWPATAAGSAAVVGSTAAALAASARLSRWALMALAVKPPKAAARARVSSVGSGRISREIPCRGADGGPGRGGLLNASVAGGA
ncbi:hypothetical protein D3C71_1331740 [compost metagenome]